jgi:hypothetical protein
LTATALSRSFFAEHFASASSSVVTAIIAPHTKHGTRTSAGSKSKNGA